MGNTESVVSDAVTGYIGSLRARHRRAAYLLDEAARRFEAGSTSLDWQSVGLACRDAIIEFVEETYGWEPGDARIPEDKTGARIEATLSYLGDKASGSEARALIERLSSYVLRVQHKRSSSNEDAQRALVTTVAVLGELDALITTAADADEYISRYGIFRCEACKSREIEPREVWDATENGPYVAEGRIECLECGWFKSYGPWQWHAMKEKADGEAQSGAGREEPVRDA